MSTSDPREHGYAGPVDDGDEDAPPPLTGWDEIGYVTRGWLREPPPDVHIGERPHQFTARTGTTLDASYAMHYGKAYLETGAELSPKADHGGESRYRWSLWRTWDRTAPGTFLVIGLNPSTADDRKDDPTIRRCVSFAKREGCGRLVMLNLFAFRATDPSAIRRLQPNVRLGDMNDYTIRAFARQGGKALAAWGALGTLDNRSATVRAILAECRVPLYCLGRTKGGEPRHPLYVRGDKPLEPFDT